MRAGTPIDPTYAGEGIMSTISGFVLLKETSVGIPRLLVVLSSTANSVPGTPSAPPASVILPANRRAAIVTDETGAFSVSLDDLGLQTNTTTRPDLHLTVMAPEEPGVSPDALVLYSSTVPRQNAAAIEQYVIRLTTAQLQKAEIPLPSEVAGKFKAMAARQNDFVSGAISAAQDVVLGHRTRVASFQQKFK